MSHEGKEVRPDRAAETTGPMTGPEPSEADWPGPSGLGGPGSEELPVPQEAQSPEASDAPGQPDGAGWLEPAMDTTAGAGLAEIGANGEAARERDEYLESLLRLQAEFDNYRKRVQRQQREILENAAASLAKKLLPVLDTADLALAHGGGEDVKQVAGALFDILSKEGLERIDPEGQPFDPAHHDAVAHEPVEGQGAPEIPEVSEVLRAGYLWKGQVLRPAMVKVRG
jgi:molecular chaperone GrpE